MYTDFTFEDLGQGIKICISDEHRFGTDAFLLADFAAPRKKDYVCDFCTGSGIIALLMKRDNNPAFIDAIEIQKKAHEQLKITIDKSKLCGINAVLGDLKDYRAQKELDLITCNPPYKINDTGLKNDSDAVTIARHETICSIDDVCKSASKNLKFGGRLCICNRPERLCDCMRAMRLNGIEPKRVRFVSKRPDTAPWLFLLEGKKGSKPFMKVEPPLFIQDEKGENSPELMRIYGKVEKK